MVQLLYLGSSAIVKLLIKERESPALRRALQGRPQRISSALAQVEGHLAAARREPAPTPERVGRILAGLTLVPVDQPVLEHAASLHDPHLRALDAIHLSTAHSLGRDLGSLIAYDSGLLAAAQASGLPIEKPV